MENLVVLDAATIGENSIFDSFKTFGKLTVFATTSTAERLQYIGNASIIITNKVIIDKEIMDACQSLKLICITATGTNNVDLEYAKEKGITVIYITHYMNEALAADRVVVMDKGSLAFQGTPVEVFSQPERLEKLALEAPLAVRLAAKLRSQGIKSISQKIISNQELAENLCR